MLPLDTACDLVKRFAEARAPVFFLDQAGQQVGFLIRKIRLEHGGSVAADLTAEHVE